MDTLHHLEVCSRLVLLWNELQKPYLTSIFSSWIRKSNPEKRNGLFHIRGQSQDTGPWGPSDSLTLAGEWQSAQLRMESMLTLKAQSPSVLQIQKASLQASWNLPPFTLHLIHSQLRSQILSGGWDHKERDNVTMKEGRQKSLEKRQACP